MLEEDKWLLVDTEPLFSSWDPEFYYTICGSDDYMGEHWSQRKTKGTGSVLFCWV